MVAAPRLTKILLTGNPRLAEPRLGLNYNRCFAACRISSASIRIISSTWDFLGKASLHNASSDQSLEDDRRSRSMMNAVSELASAKPIPISITRRNP